MSRVVDVDENLFDKNSREWFFFLGFYGIHGPRIQEVADCGNVLSVGVCSEGKKYANGWYCNNRGVCPVCDELEAWTQSLDRLVLLTKLFNAAKRNFHVWRVDFTIGKDLWSKVDRDGLSRYARIGYETMQEYFNEKLGWKVRFGMDIAPQFWHSNNAGLEFDPHLHCVIPRLFVDEETGRVSTVDLMYINHARIKAIWRRRVEEVYGKSAARFRSGDSERFSVRLTYYDHVGPPLPERLKYVYRGIVFNYEGTVNSGSDYSHWDKEFVRWSLTTRHKRHIGYGLLSARNLSAKSAFMRMLGVNYKNKMERRKARRKACPDCGSVIERLHDVPLMSHEEAREQGLKRLKADFMAELKREADGRYVSFHKQYGRDYA